MPGGVRELGSLEWGYGRTSDFLYLWDEETIRAYGWKGRHPLRSQQLPPEAV